MTDPQGRPRSEVDDRSAQPADAPAEANEQAAPAEEIDWKDRCMRVAADFENHKKRTREEMRRIADRERDKVLVEVLDVTDSVERALAGCAGTEGPWVDGLRAIGRQMTAAMERFGVEPMQSDEQTFDPNIHEAIGAVPVPGVADGTIVQTERTGYQYKRDGRVLRPARVVVARGGGGQS